MKQLTNALLCFFSFLPVSGQQISAAPAKTVKTGQPSAQQHIMELWPVLTRLANPHLQATGPTGSPIPLVKPYVVPGGRFGEIYYWDSYFTIPG